MDEFRGQSFVEFRGQTELALSRKRIRGYRSQSRPTHVRTLALLCSHKVTVPSTKPPGFRARCRPRRGIMKIPDRPASGPLSSTLGEKSVSKSRSWGTEGTQQVVFGWSPKKSKKRKRRKSAEEQPAKTHYAPDRNNRPVCGAHSTNIRANEWNFRKDENRCQRCLGFLERETLKLRPKSKKTEMTAATLARAAAPKKHVTKLPQRDRRNWP